MTFELQAHQHLKMYRDTDTLVGTIYSAKDTIKIEIEKLLVGSYKVYYEPDAYSFMSYYCDSIDLEEINSNGDIKLIGGWH